MEAEKVSHQSTPVPSLNEILAQLHQDPGFRQRYKDYCRAVLDGRFNFGGIKNPIFDHIYGNGGSLNPKQKQPDGGQPKTHQTFQIVGQHPADRDRQNGVTLLKQQPTSYAQSQQHPHTYKPKHLDTLNHGANGGGHQHKAPPVSAGPTISEAAYFIQRVNRILQTQGTNESGPSAQNVSQSNTQMNQS